MYIEPNTTIYIIKNCPLDPTYDHTIFWNSKQEQTNYFQGIKKFTLTNQTYQRVKKGTIRVGIKAEELYDCNYVMFQNTAFGDKWFYAFINSVEYVNNITSEISFLLDVMQTWFFDYELDMCYVDREHSLTDKIGDNTVPEGLEQGPYVQQSGTPARLDPENALSPRIMILSTFDQSDDTFPDYYGAMANSMYCGLDVGFFDYDFQFNAFMEKVVKAGKASGIIAVYAVPFDKAAFETGYVQEFSISKNYTDLHGYTPKNNKLFTYPYNVLRILNDEASSDYRYEEFMESQCTFTWLETAVPEPSITLVPRSYAGNFGLDRSRRMTLTNFPLCPYTTNVYERYLAENASSIPLRMVSAELGLSRAATGMVGGMFSNLLSGDLAGTVNAGIQGIYDIQDAELKIKGINAQLTDIERKPPEMSGVQTGSADWNIGAKHFVYKKMTIKPEYAKIIDDYFTMFGYATHRVKVPNRSSRPHWNYVKTVACVVTGSVPADNIRDICAIYNHGITFWKNPSEIGNYNLDNSPV